MLRDTARSPGFKVGTHLSYSTLGVGSCALCASWGFPCLSWGALSLEQTALSNSELAHGLQRGWGAGRWGYTPPRLVLRSGLSFREGR